MRGKTINGILSVFLILFAVSMTLGATEEEKQVAIEKGLAYLAEHQNSDGSWPSGDPDGGIYSTTGASVLAFLQAKGYWGENAVAYQAAVDKGLNFILGSARIVNISPQPYGNPDGDGNGKGVKISPSTSIYPYDNVATGSCLPALVASGTPDTFVTVGPLADQANWYGTGPNGQWTYRDVVQNAIDYLAYAQNDSGSGEGGWWKYYGTNNYFADQTDTQWAVIAGMYASLMGISYPDFVLSELGKWTVYIQNADGSAGYTSPTSLYQCPEGQTGALLTMLFFLGESPGDLGSVDLALNYINSIWDSDATSLSGNFGHPYTMRAIYNGLGFMIGLDDEGTITNLRGGLGSNNPNHEYNWWEDYCEFLVRTQNPDGSWNGLSYNWTQSVATPWFVYILAGMPDSEAEPIEVPVDIKPAACPNQLNVMSKGMLAVAIAGSEDLDVTTIDPLTIQLAGVAPNHYSYNDVASPYTPMTGKEDAYACTAEGSDGYPDMILQFEVQAIFAAIGEVEDGDVRVLSLTGNLLEESGGTAVIGEDVVSILKKAGGNNNGNPAHGTKPAPGKPNS